MDIITSGAARTMTSREIAELTGKELSNVHRDIRSMLICLYGDDNIEIIVPEQRRNRHSEYIRENADALLSAIAGDGSNRNHQDQRGFAWERDNRGYITVFHLDYSHSMSLVSGYNVRLRKAIIDRWQQLETTAAPALPQTFAAALRALADQTELAEQQAAALALAAPKAEALDRLSGAEGSLCLTEAAKVLKIAPRRLTAWLSEHAWIYKRAGARHWVAYQDRIQQGVMEHRTTTLERPDGTDKVVDQVLVTGKGLARLAKLLGVAA